MSSRTQFLNSGFSPSFEGAVAKMALTSILGSVGMSDMMAAGTILGGNELQVSDDVTDIRWQLSDRR